MSLVQDFTLQADTREQLVLAVNILLKWTNKVTHYRTGVDKNGLPYLVLMWSEGDSPRKGTPLMASMDKAEAIADQLLAWLKSQEYGREPDHDGSNHRGYTVTNWAPEMRDPQHTWGIRDRSPYDFLYIAPTWIEYHK